MRLRMRPAVLAAGLVLAGMTTHAWMNERMLAQAQRMGPPAAARAQVLAQEIVEAQGLDEIARLKGVNAFFNRAIVFREDKDVWGQVDYWASPLEMMNRGQGDCEDFSIAKYVTLGLLGVPLERLRITYVRAETGLPGSGIVQAHMVLAYYPAPGVEPLILDNLVGQLRPASRRPDLKPVFGFNSQGLWVAGKKASADPTARLSRWRDLLRRMNEEGLN